MKTIGLVAVRMKSSRLKKKALLDLGGKPIILQLLQRLRKSNRLDDIILCTSTHSDDNVLLELASENGFKSFAGSEDDVIHRFIYVGEREGADIIVRITGDNPLTDPGLIDIMVESHLNSGADYTRMDNLPIGVTAEVITFKALRRAFELAENTKYSEYMTLYFMENPTIFDLNILQADPGNDRPQYRLTVDYVEDYCLMKAIFTQFISSEWFSIKDVIEFLDNNPSIIEINSQIDQINIDPEINVRLRT